MNVARPVPGKRTMNHDKHVEDRELQRVGETGCMRRRIFQRSITRPILLEQIAKRLADNHVAGEAKVRLGEGLWRVEDGLLAWEFAFQLGVVQTTGVVLEEGECAIHE